MNMVYNGFGKCNQDQRDAMRRRSTGYWPGEAGNSKREPGIVFFGNGVWFGQGLTS